MISLGEPATEVVTYTGSFSLLIDAGAGNDTIFDPGENTTILGGPGNDTIVIDATTGTGVVLDGGPGSDTYIIGGGAIGDLAGPVAVADTGTTGIDTVTILGTSGDDSIAQTSGGFSLNTTYRFLAWSPLPSMVVAARTSSLRRACRLCRCKW